MQKSERIGVYGEYKLSLHEVNYLQCENGYRKTQDSYNRVCDVNFSVTKPYIIQKTPAGNVENVKIDTTTVDLSKFLMYADGTPTNFSAQLGKVISTGGVYNPTKEVKDALNGFINKYSKLAVKVNSSLFGSTDVKKVPGKDIYFVNGNITIDGFRFTYDVSKTKKTETKGTNSIYDRPFTIVQTVGNTTIKGNLNHNMMLLTNGAITFDGSNNCNDAQVVKGIFYAGMDFKSANVAKNDRLNNTDRCIGGNLHIKGIAIGKGLDNVAANRRSELNQWFRSRSSQDQSATDRRNYIMNGAAVLIEYATSVFTKATMPPGAEEFTTALAVYRQ
ncbi:hypothetical protein FACS189428_6910 [Clostridia bacterium]|nr:hypothetical protein FACS189428_6910 [Clostridia bacterium]